MLFPYVVDPLKQLPNSPPVSASQQSQPGSIAMMKIDCQVINTQMVHIRKDAIPVHMSSNFRQTNVSEDLEKTAREEDSEVGLSFYTKTVGKVAFIL